MLHNNNKKKENLPSTAVVQENTKFRVSSGFSFVYSGVLICGSVSPVRGALSTCICDITVAQALSASRTTANSEDSALYTDLCL